MSSPLKLVEIAQIKSILSTPVKHLVILLQTQAQDVLKQYRERLAQLEDQYRESKETIQNNRTLGAGAFGDLADAIKEIARSAGRDSARNAERHETLIRVLANSTNVRHRLRSFSRERLLLCQLHLQHASHNTPPASQGSG